MWLIFLSMWKNVKKIRIERRLKAQLNIIRETYGKKNLPASLSASVKACMEGPNPGAPIGGR